MFGSSISLTENNAKTDVNTSKRHPDVMHEGRLTPPVSDVNIPAEYAKKEATCLIHCSEIKYQLTNERKKQTKKKKKKEI